MENTHSICFRTLCFVTILAIRILEDSMNSGTLRIRLTLSKSPGSQEKHKFTSIWDNLPSEQPHSTVRRNATFNPHKKDYRLGPLRIDWIDLKSPMEASRNAPQVRTSQGKLSERKGQHIARFEKIASGSTNLPEGVLRIFRERRLIPSYGSSEVASTSAAMLPSTTVTKPEVTIGVLAVPAYMTPSDFLTFIAPAAEGITHLRMIRDSAPNRSMVVIRFTKEEDASDFIEAYNGKPFNSMEPETCHVVRVSAIEIEDDDTVSQAISKIGDAADDTISSSSYELPTCPVCLERMDSAVTGLITVPCSHTFHCMCLSKWGDSRCPVCRYSQNHFTASTSSRSPSASSSRVPVPTSAATSVSSSVSTALSACVDCGSTTNLWICLICGNIGCGRYGRAHAHAHYTLTTHLYALELETQRVWDYAGDGYVHRLIQNKADGKLVELPSASMRSDAVATASGSDMGGGPGLADRIHAEKVEAIGIEYSYLLTSQLESQREYYEERTEELRKELSGMSALLEQLQRAMESTRAEAQESIEALRREQVERTTSLEKDKTKAEKKAEKLGDIARRLEKELKEERAVSEGLMKNMSRLKDRAEQADKAKDKAEREKAELMQKVHDLEDQVRDVMFSLEVQSKIEKGDGDMTEAVGGSIEVLSPPQPNASSSTAKKKKNRK